MGKYIRGICWLAFFATLAFNLYAWGGLALTPRVGEELREQARGRAPLASLYMFAGRHAVNALGRPDPAVAFARRHFREDAYTGPHPEGQMVGRFKDAQSAVSELCYLGAPLLLVLSVALHARRQKPVRSFGGRG